MNLSDTDSFYDTLQKQKPEMLRELSPKRYNTQEGGYPSHKLMVYIDHAQVLSAAISCQKNNMTHAHVGNLHNMSARLACGAQTYFLAKPLGEALLRTAPPVGIGVEDLKWPFPSFRVVLPAGLVYIDEWNVPFMDLQLTRAGESEAAELPFPPALKEYLGPLPPVIISKGALNLNIGIPTTGGVHHFHKGCLWEDKTVADLFNRHQPALQGGVTHEQHEKLDTLLLLGINLITFMGALPGEISAEHEIRKEKTKKGVWREGLWTPRFIGRQTFFDHLPTTDNKTGVRMPPHWRCGHWKRQAHGPELSLRKTLWIQPYCTGKLDEAA